MSVVQTLTTANYATFALFALLLTLAPGPDFAVVSRNAVVGGRVAGLWTALGVSASNVVQGSAVALGLGALIVRSQPAFEAIRWAGVVYLVWLGLQALRSAWRGPAQALSDAGTTPIGPRRGDGFRRWRQGFLSNITNPKVLVFYLSVLPQFLHPGSPAVDALALAYTHAVLGLSWLSVLVMALHTMRRWIGRRRVRQALDAVTGTVLLGFAGRLATEAR
jgi:threonine/homoserine/homoserine lactone efflux protein